MGTTHEVTLTLASTRTRLTVWDRYDIVQDLFQPGSPWTFSLWHSDEVGSAWEQMVTEVRLGDRVEVAIDGAVQLNGRIEAAPIHVDEQGGAVLVISGRDLAGPATEAHADPRVVLRNATLEHVFGELFNRIGIEVIVDASADAAREVQSRARPGRRGARSATTAHHRRTVDLSRAREGETVWQVAESILRRMGLMAWVAPSDRAATELALVIGVPDYTHAPVYRLERRVVDGRVAAESNILQSAYERQIRGIPTQVYAAADAPRGDHRPARHVAGASNNQVFMLSPLSAFGAVAIPAATAAAMAAAPVPRVVLSPLSAFGAVELPPMGAAPPALASPVRRPTVATRVPYANPGLRGNPLVIDPLPPSPRFLHTRRSRSPATARQEAERVMAEAMRHFRTYECTVQGHGQPTAEGMRLYAINTLALVRDDVSRLNEPMLIHRVQFSGGRGTGCTTRLTLGPRGAVVLTPEPS